MHPDRNPVAMTHAHCLKAIIAVLVLLMPILTSARNAPVTTAGSSSVCPGSAVTIPVSVTDFVSVKAITLRLDYDPAKLAYVNYSNLNPALASATITNISVSPTLSKVIIFWLDVNALSLANNTVMFNLEFTHLDSSSVVTFNNSANNGGDCEYADEFGVAMTDVPSSSFYFDATITNNAIGTTGTITGPGNVCAGAGNVSYSIAPVPNATSYTWIVPAGVTILSGSNTNSITVAFSFSAISGNISVFGSNICGQSQPSILPVTVHQPPVPGLIGPGVSCTGASGVVYSTEPGMSDYQWAISSGGSVTAGSGTSLIQASWNSAGNQWVSVNYTDLNGCTAGMATQMNVLVNNLPGPAAAVTGPDTVCAGTSGMIYHTDPVFLATSYNWTVPTGATITSGAGTNQIMVSFAPTPGTGTISVAGVNECGSGLPSQDFSVAMISAPPAPVVTANGALLTSSVATGNQWFYEGTGAIPGANQQTYTATVTGWYWTAMEVFGCPSLESNHVYVLFTGAPETGPTPFQVFPVPCDGSFAISPIPPDQGPLFIEISDQLGQAIYAGWSDPSNISGRLDMNLRPVSRGMYFLRIVAGKREVTRKILVR